MDVIVEVSGFRVGDRGRGFLEGFDLVVFTFFLFFRRVLISSFLRRRTRSFCIIRRSC